MARRRTNYNVDTRTKILDSHTQFMGGLKTVDTDDSVKDFFLRDVENISLSEFGFLERRYGLVEDANLQFLVDVENEIEIPNTDNSYFKDRLQGYFEYTRKDKVVEQIIFYNGRLYLNGVQITQLYQYPSKFDPILGNYNNNISVNDFINYMDRVHGKDFTSFDDIDNLFNTGRQVEGVKIDDRMFFFTGIYPIVYEGTGEFYLLPEYVTNFEQLALFSHNLHTADLDTTYTAGFPASEITLNMANETRGYFSDLGYAPMYPYMMGEGAGFEIRMNYKLPPISVYTIFNFTGFFDQETQPVSGSGGRYIELVPEVYYRGSGLSFGEVVTANGDVIVDETWTRVAPSNVDYTVLSNRATSQDYDELFYTSILDETIPSFINNEEASFASEPLYSSNQKSFNITLKNIPSGLNDVLILYKIYQASWNSTGTEVIEKVIDQTVEVIRNITFTREKTDDYVNLVTDDEGNQIPVPVNDPASLWTCNRVINHYGKLMAYGSLIHPERIFISHPTFIHYFPYFFTRDFETDTQEAIEQITPFMNILVVQSESFTWGLKGIDAVIGAENFYTPFVISPIYGTIAPKSVRPVRNQLFFLSQDGIVSIQSLYAIDEQYNVKHIDKNIENIVPLDPEAVAIQYDNQYWIQFPNTKNNMTLRYHVDLKAWMKDTYFEWNGLDENNKVKRSETIFNGVHKYIREDDKLVLITNPMRLGKNLTFVDDDENYRVMRLYVDYSIATDIKEIPRALFETSYLDQDYPFNEKKYLEEKMQFTVQNEYHFGKEPIFRDESMVMVSNLIDNQNEAYTYTLYDQPLIKNHDYQIIVPNVGAAPYENERANIKQINVRLFDIQGNLIHNLNFKDNTAPMPSIYNFKVFPGTQTIQFGAFNNEAIVGNNIYYAINGNEKTGNIENVPAQDFETITISGIDFGTHKLELWADRGGTQEAFSQKRVLYFQMPDGVYNEFTYEPIVPSLSPVQLSAVPIHRTATVDDRNLADRITVTWEDQNDGSQKYRYRYRVQGGSVLGSQEVTEKTFNIDFTEQQAIDNEGLVYVIEVDAFYENQWSIPATFEIALEYFDELPTTVTGLFDLELLESEQLKFGWNDSNYQTGYEIYFKYKNDTFNTLEDYPATQKKIVSASTDMYLFDTTGELINRVQIPKNSIVDFLIRATNQNGTSANDATRQGIYRAHYPVDGETNPLIIAAVDGQSGFRVTIPEALKTTATAENYVFEDQWEIQYYKADEAVNFSESVFYNTEHTKNYFEVIDLEPQTEYRVRFRGVYTVNGTTETPLAFQTIYYITATTGDEAPQSATAPTISSLARQSGSTAGSSVIGFQLIGNHSPFADVYYLITTNNNDTVSDTNFTGSFSIGNGSSRGVFNVAVNDATTYYVKAAAKTNTSLLSDVVSSLISIPAFVIADFSSNGGTPPYDDQSGYAPLSVSNPGTPSRSGYSFNGWSLGGSLVSFPRSINGDSQFIAVWTSTAPTSYTATYNLDLDGNIEFYTTRSVVSGQLASSNLPPNPTRTGYTFAGWSPDPGQTVMYSNETFIGQMDPVAATTYTVTFNYWNGSSFGNHSSQTGTTGTTINYPTNLPDSPGGVFAGWSPNPTTIGTANITVVAQYLP